LSSMDDADLVVLLTSITIGELVAFLTGAFLTGAFLAGAFLAGVFLAGVLAGAFLAGVFLMTIDSLPVTYI